MFIEDYFFYYEDQFLISNLVHTFYIIHIDGGNFKYRKRRFVVKTS